MMKIFLSLYVDIRNLAFMAWADLTKKPELYDRINSNNRGQYYFDRLISTAETLATTDHEKLLTKSLKELSIGAFNTQTPAQLERTMLAFLKASENIKCQLGVKIRNCDNFLNPDFLLTRALNKDNGGVSYCFSHHYVNDILFALVNRKTYVGMFHIPVEVQLYVCHSLPHVIHAHTF